MKLVLLFFLLPAAAGIVLPTLRGMILMYKAEREERFAAAIREGRRQHAEKIKTEQTEAKAIKADAPKRKPGRPRKESAEAPAADLLPDVAEIKGNNAFAHHVVAFTGTLPEMTRAEAIAAVIANGGKAFETMPASTTLLVVGDHPGRGKIDKADEWIDRVKKITPAQFNAMLKAPLTLSLDEFADLIAKGE